MVVLGCLCVCEGGGHSLTFDGVRLSVLVVVEPVDDLRYLEGTNRVVLACV